MSVYATMRNKLLNVNPAREYQWSIEFMNVGKKLNSLMGDFFTNTGSNSIFNVYAKDCSIPVVKLKETKVNINGWEKVFPAKGDSDHSSDINFFESQEVPIESVMKLWENAFHPFQTDVSKSSNQQYMAIGDKYDENGNYDLSCDLKLTMYKYGNQLNESEDAKFKMAEIIIYGVFPTNVSTFKPDREASDKTKETKVDFACDWAEIKYLSTKNTPTTLK